MLQSPTVARHRIIQEPDKWDPWEAGRYHLKLDEVLDKLKADGHRMSPACSDQVEAHLLELEEKRAAQDLEGYRAILADIGRAAILDHEGQKAGTIERPAPRATKRGNGGARIPSNVSP